MRAEISNLVAGIEKSLGLLRHRLNWETAEFRLEELNAMSEDPNLWADPPRAQKLMRERQQLLDAVEGYRALDRGLRENVELIELGEAEGDAEVVADAEGALRGLAENARQREIEALLNGEADANDTFLEVNAGAGGTESCDWAAMLARMYVRWAEAHGYKVELIDESPGEEAGIKSATYKIIGPNAYGWLKTESGVHRLVRISPFDAQARRHTSFSAVWVYPVVDDNIDIEINEKDIRLDTMRSSGAGGQHVNKTESAVRITHLPSGLVVACQEERSQHKNRAKAMKVLQSRLYDLLESQQQAAHAAERKSQVGSGDRSERIRTYNVPQGRCTDHRIGLTLYRLEAIMEGDLDEIFDALS
ncbi:MAG TPA: peptide chain release factor 2, partial [Paracoccaceae bacterium]|nr:peptide chain release factor 2 [Paracoccaceae bacterium]